MKYCRKPQVVEARQLEQKETIKFEFGAVELKAGTYIFLDSYGEEVGFCPEKMFENDYEDCNSQRDE